MVRGVHKSIVSPIGERVAMLERDVPAIAEAMTKGFEELGKKLDTLNTTVTTLATAEAERVGAAKERKKFINRRDVTLTAGSSFVGGIVGYFAQFLHHQ